MNDTPPTPEAVEAAMKYATFKEYSAADFAALNDYSQDPCEPTIGTAARILAAEVERLRAELKEAKDWHPRIIRKYQDDTRELTRLRLENEELRARVAELEQTATPIPRPDRPGWWWKWSEDALPPRWLQCVVEPYIKPYVSPHDGLWLPATPPPAPKEEGEE